MQMLYILDEKGNPIPENDPLEWSKWFEKPENRRIAVSELGDIRVSTFFLGISHFSKDGNYDALYETMVFADKDKLARVQELSESDDRSIIAMFLGEVDIQKRYRTKDEALEGHKQMCNFIEVCIFKGLL